MDPVFSRWKTKTSKELKVLQSGHHPREVINKFSEALLAAYKTLVINRYFANEQQAIDGLNAELETQQNQMSENDRGT